MKVEQISIFLENRPGSLEQVSKILKEAGINIRTLTLAPDGGLTCPVGSAVVADSRARE